MHPEGFHKDEEAKERCYGCSHPEKLEITNGDRCLAKQLVADGWLSISAKYHVVARLIDELPEYEQGVVFAENVPEWFRALVQRSYNWRRDYAIRDAPKEAVMRRELTLTEYRAFKEAGGKTA